MIGFGKSAARTAGKPAKAPKPPKARRERVPREHAPRREGSLWSALQRAVIGSDLAADAASRAILPEYRRPVPATAKVTLLVLLVVAGLALGLLFSLLAPARMMPFAAPLIIVAGLIIWSIPTGETAPTGILVGLFFSFFAAFILWPNYLAIALPSLPWVTMLRLIAAPLITTLLICLVASRPFRTRMKDILSSDPWIWKLLVGFVVIQTVTLPLSNDINTSINRYIIAQCNLTAVFFVSCYVFSRKGAAQLWVYLLLAMLTILCGFGIWESQLRQVPWAGHIPSFLRVGDESVSKVLLGAARQATGIYRVQGVQTTSLGFAEILGLAVPFAVHLMIDKYPRTVRLLGAAFVPLAFFVIILTDSRLGVVACGASLLFYFLIWGLLRWRKHQQSLIGPAIVLSYPLLFTAVILSTFFVGRIRAEVWGNGPQQASTAAREIQWSMAIPKIMHNPIGHGTARSANALGFTNQAGVITIDSYYLTALLEWGIMGFCLFFGLILRGIYRGSVTVLDHPAERDTRLLMPISVALVNFIIVKSVLSQDFNHPIVFMLLGAIVALVFRVQRPYAATAG